MIVKRGNILIADLGKENGSIQTGVRPVMVIQNDIGNRYSPTFIAVPITSKVDKRQLVTHKVLKGYKELVNKSTVITEQILTLNKTQIIKYICHAREEDIIEVNNKIAISLALVN